MPGMPDPSFDTFEEYDEESLGESLDPTGQETPKPLDFDSIFGPEPTMAMRPDPARRIANPIIAAIKTMTAFDMAQQFLPEDLIAYRDLNGDAGNDLVKLNAWTKADLAASIATRLATRAVAPSTEELEAAESPLSTELREMDDRDFEALVSLVQGAGQSTFGGNKIARQMLKKLNAPQPEEGD